MDKTLTVFQLLKLEWSLDQRIQPMPLWRNPMVWVGFAIFGVFWFFVIQSFDPTQLSTYASRKAVYWTILSIVLTTGILTLFGAMDNTLKMLFESGELRLLSTAPIRPEVVFTSRFLRDTWALFVIYFYFVTPSLIFIVAMNKWQLLGLFPTVIGFALMIEGFAVLSILLLLLMIGAKATRGTGQILISMMGILIFVLEGWHRSSRRGMSPIDWIQQQLAPYTQPSGPLHLDSWFWMYPRAILGEPLAIVTVVSSGILLLGLGRILAPKIFYSGMLEYRSVGSASKRNFKIKLPRVMQTNLTLASLLKEWRLLVRAPDIASQLLLETASGLRFVFPAFGILWNIHHDLPSRMIALTIVVLGPFATVLIDHLLRSEQAGALLMVAPQSLGVFHRIKVLSVTLLTTLLSWICVSITIFIAPNGISLDRLILGMAIIFATMLFCSAFRAYFTPVLRIPLDHRGSSDYWIFGALIGIIIWECVFYFVPLGHQYGWWALVFALGSTFYFAQVLWVNFHKRFQDNNQ